MVSINNSSRNHRNYNKLDGPTLPFLYFCLGAIFMSLFGRLSTMMNISSGKAYRNELDPHAILQMNQPNHQHVEDASGVGIGIVVPDNQAEGGLPNLNPKQEYQHFVDELKKKQQTISDLEDKYQQAQLKLKEQEQKIAKYESVVDELYKSRRRYGLSEEEKESLNMTLSKVEDKMDQVRSILRGGGGGGGAANGGDGGGAR